MDDNNLLRDRLLTTSRFNQRLRILCALIGFVALMIFIRISELQLVEHKKYSGLAKHNFLAMMPTPAPRGKIYDRNGVVLATNRPSYTLTITPSKITNLTGTLARLRHIIPISTKEEHHFHLAITRHHRYEPIAIKFNLTELQIAQFYLDHYRFPGVNIATSLRRTYPQGKDFAHVVGYVGSISSRDHDYINNKDYRASHYVGKAGVEQYYEKQLHGKEGIALTQINASGQVINPINDIPAQPGANLTLTIDSRLQHTAYQLLKQHSGALVAINPNDGSVLAMASNPSFDPNLFANGISQAQYQTLLHAKGQPLYNKTTRGLYSPGSTIKPFIGIGALSNNFISAETSIFDKGWFRLPHTKHIYHDWRHNGHGWVNLYKAITVSCDTFFYELAVQMGINSLDQDFFLFGFGMPTGLDLPNESSGLIPTPEWKKKTQHHPWYTGDTIITGIGQGSLLVTPIQLASATAALAMRGERYQPHVINSTRIPGSPAVTSVSHAKPPAYLDNTANWELITRAMVSVIQAQRGTATEFGKYAPYSAAAKTGTAQVYRKNRPHFIAQTSLPYKLRNNHLFIAFAPVKHPTIALAVVIEHDRDDQIIARHFLDRYFQLSHSKHPHAGPL